MEDWDCSAIHISWKNMKNKGKVKVSKKTKKNKSHKIRWTTYVLLFIDFCAILGVLAMYGPISFARDWYVTTAMGTGTKRYLAQIFYSNDSINKILDENSIYFVDEDIDLTGVNVGDWQSDGNYASIYEQEILERESPDQEYKVIRINENKYKGYLVVIYDPSRISLAIAQNINSYGNLPSEIAKKNGAKVFINGSAFTNGSGKVSPVGTTIRNGKIISRGSPRSNGGLIGFTNEDILVVCKDTQENINQYNFRDAVSFGPFFVVNGKPSYTSGQAGGLQPRTAIGQRKDGIVLFLVIDGRSYSNGNGASYADLTKIFIRYGAYNAGNMDGGGSSTLIVDGKLVNQPCGYGSCGQGYVERYVPNGWMFK